MQQRDYVLRLIEQALAAITRVRELKKASQNDEARDLVDETLASLLGLAADGAVAMPVTSLLVVLSRGSHIDLERAALATRLLHERGLLLTAQGDTAAARQHHIKAFCLYDELAKHPGSASVLEPHQDAILWLRHNLQ